LSGFKRFLIKASLRKVPALEPLTNDLYERARAFAATGPDTDAGDEAGVQLIIAAHELIASARRLRGARSTSPSPAKDT
jgi:hypothetical protein